MPREAERAKNVGDALSVVRANEVRNVLVCPRHHCHVRPAVTECGIRKALPLGATDGVEGVYDGRAVRDLGNLGEKNIVRLGAVEDVGRPESLEVLLVLGGSGSDDRRKAVDARRLDCCHGGHEYKNQ